MVECVVPILRVQNLAASIDHYVTVLGFQRDWQAVDDAYAIGGVSRDGCSLMLCEGAQGQPGTWVWIGVEDIEVLHRELLVSGATIRHGVRNYPWAQELRVEDPDGHVLRFAGEPRTDQPYDTYLP